MIQSGTSTFRERMKARWDLLGELKHRLLTEAILAGVQATPALDTAKLRFTNVETPGFAFSEQTDAERKSNYQLISDVISALGIQNCCGADAKAVTANEDKIKTDLELKNIEAREKAREKRLRKRISRRWSAGGRPALLRFRCSLRQQRTRKPLRRSRNQSDSPQTARPSATRHSVCNSGRRAVDDRRVC